MSGTTLCFGLLVTVCAPIDQTNQLPLSNFCEIYKQVATETRIINEKSNKVITWSRNDTRATKENINRLNRVYKRLCL